MTHRYEKSEYLLNQTKEIIPLASQTFSKSHTQFPYGVSPYFIQKGKGSSIWDVDGNHYIDFMNGLLSISLGYCDPDVDSAIKMQLESGISFSLPHPIEGQLAKKIIQHVPCAEMVRYGKNGSDATAGAVRIARAYTKKDLVAVCGYHGWQDWYIGSTTRNLGVPKSTQELTLKFNYNDIDSLKQLFKDHPNKISAVILEPMNVFYPKKNFLEDVKTICKQNGALLIFDEIITGFRFGMGGAQALFNVTPDLCTMGKGLANGLPLSLITGKAEYMSLLEDIFFSFTFGGETLSLTAALAAIEKMEKYPVHKHIECIGNNIIESVENIISKNNLQSWISIEGHPSWSFLIFNDINNYSSWDLKTYYMQELLQNGFLGIGTHNLSYAHSQSDTEKLISFYEVLFSKMNKLIQKNQLHQNLRTDTLKPLFNIR